ncbi:30S ribosomal protein S7 [Patescibacteria group bacterium]|nr:30S ribosomal protein S7 [Patescibacteria group bacterium]MCH7756652.1 30S ribosomal protein S7 [Patescibacteria group bacterium]
MRRKVKVKFQTLPDRVHNSVTLSRFINFVMKGGKKNTARTIVYGAFDEITSIDKNLNPFEVFEEALVNVGPLMEVRSRRVGGANYQVPREVRPERRLALAMRWIIDAANAKSGTSMQKRLANELIAASKKEGEAVKKKENMHKMAEANRAFAHFAW